MITTSLRRLALCGLMLVCFACVWSPDVFSQGLTITTSSPLPDGVVSSAYSQTLTATGGIAGLYVWQVLSGSLPAGLTLSAGGLLSGTPTAAGTSNFRIRVTNLALSGEKDFALRINAPLAVTTTSPLPSGTVGVAYSQSLAASGGTGPYTWSIITGALPGGLSLSSGGLISGTPTAAVITNFTVQAVDSSTPAQTVQKGLTLTIVPLTITTSSPLPLGQTGIAYSQTFSASGGTSPYTWTVTAGALPAGLTLSAAGLLSGTPTAAGTSNFTVRVTDSSAPAVNTQKAFTLEVVAPLAVTTASPMPLATQGVDYSQTLAASGGTAPYSWSVTAGTLPAGLTLSSAGLLSGTPTATGTSDFTVQVSDSHTPALTATKAMTLVVAVLTITTASPLPPGTIGTAYSQTFTASAGTTPYTWTITAGTLPAGLTLSAAGLLSGTPTATGTSNFTVRVTDSSKPKLNVQKAFALDITAALTITTSSPLPFGQTGTAYSQTFAATGGTSPYTWAVTAGTLPAGLTLSAAGLLSGTPTAADISNFTVRVTDSSTPALTVQKAFVLETVIGPSITTASPLPSGMPGVAYSQTLAASDGSAPYSWSVTAGTLPAGLTLSAAGLLSGTPTTAGTSNFTVQVSDSHTPALTSTKAFILDVVLPLVITTASPLPSGVPGAAYSQNLSAAGGLAPYNWSVISGVVPAGLSLSGTGLLSGTPTTGGTSSFTVRVIDGTNPPQNFQKSFTVTIVGALTITTASLPSAATGTAYSQNLAAAGGTTPYTWSIVSGTLPAGLTLSGATISGTPTTPGTSNFTIRVADSSSPQQTSQKALTIIIGAPLAITTPTTLPDGAIGLSYEQTLAATGGTPPLTWSFSSGTLPSGLALSGNGAITGTPTQTGAFTFAVVVSDSASPALTATETFKLHIKPALAITTASLPGATPGSPYSAQLEATGEPPLAWAQISGTLPPGITFDANGLLSGTPTTAGTFDFAVHVTSESPSQESTRAYQIVVSSTLAVATLALPQGIRLAPYTITLSAAGGVAPYNWSIVGGALPTGLSLSGAGVISGTPSVAGTFNFTVRVNDSAGGSSSKALVLTVVQGLLHITTTSVPAGIQGFAFRQQFDVTGGPAPYTWTIASGNLPSGFALSAAGVLQGTTSTVFNGTIGVKVTDSTGLSDQHDFTLVIGPPLGTVSLTGLQVKTAPLQQTPIALSIPSAYPADLQGTLSLSFVSTAVVPINDAAVQFSTGGRTVSFTIPANTTSAVFPSPFLLVTGTVAGTITMTASIQNGPSNLTLTSTNVDSTPPQMTNLTATRVTGGLSVRITGYSPERRVTEVGFSFEVRVNGVIQIVGLTRAVDSDFNVWYQSAASSPFGSAFRFEQLFSVGGDTAAIEAVTITLKNAQGTTTSARVPFTN